MKLNVEYAILRHLRDKQISQYTFSLSLSLPQSERSEEEGREMCFLSLNLYLHLLLRPIVVARVYILPKSQYHKSSSTQYRSHSPRKGPSFQSDGYSKSLPLAESVP